MDTNKFVKRCVAEVRKYVEEHWDRSDDSVYYDVYMVWHCKTLQNSKALLSTTISDGMYYEITYNGDKDEFYFDAYKKFENRCIKA